MTAPSLYFPFTLRLYGQVLTCLRDNNFAGLDLFYKIKDCWKRRDTPNHFVARIRSRSKSVHPHLLSCQAQVLRAAELQHAV